VIAGVVMGDRVDMGGRIPGVRPGLGAIFVKLPLQTAVHVLPSVEVS
jgi:hypothetical protein